MTRHTGGKGRNVPFTVRSTRERADAAEAAAEAEGVSRSFWVDRLAERELRGLSAHVEVVYGAVSDDEELKHALRVALQLLWDRGL